ncbi:MAG: ribosomal protein S18-alanine N-acetyltransferase [Pseudonocardia sp.]
MTLPAGIVIDLLRESDAAHCAELERELFPGDDPWSEQAFREEVRAGHHYLAARGVDGVRIDPARDVGGARIDTARKVSDADEGDRLVGYGGLAFVAGGWSRYRPEAEVHTIGVDPAYQGRGIGRALLRGLLAVADAKDATVFLEVRTDNDAARALYEAEGFTVVGLRHHYYASGADAHTMRRESR